MPPLKNRVGKTTAADANTKKTQYLWASPCLLAGLVYLVSLRGKFIYDDHPQILTNPQVQSWSYFFRLISTHMWSQKAVELLVPMYRPVFSVWLLIVYSIVGPRAWAWHAASLTLYMATALLFLRLARELLGDQRAACIAGLLFAVHPIHVEAVSWISACNEVLAGFFVAASLLLFAERSRLRDGWHSRRSYASLLAWTFALFTKESVLPLVVLFPMIAWHYTGGRRPRKKSLNAVLATVLPFIACACLYLLARMMVFGRLVPKVSAHSWKQVILTVPSILFFYVEKLVLPLRLSSFYVTPIHSALDQHVLISFLLAALLITGGCWLSTIDWRFGIAFSLLLGPLLPTLTAVRVFANGDIVHDRYLFLPSMGYCLLCGMLVKAMLETVGPLRPVVLTACSAVIALFAVATLKQESFYKDEKAYFGRALEVGSTNTLAMDYLGDSYMRETDMSDALRWFKRAYAVSPEDPNTLYCLARGLFQDKQFASAEPLLEMAHSDPALVPLRRFTSGLFLAKDELALQHPAQARAMLTELTAENPRAADIHLMLGSIDEVEGRSSDARIEYLKEYEISGNVAAGERAVRLAGRAPRAH